MVWNLAPLPCPFCLSDSIAIQLGVTVYCPVAKVKCTNCGAQGPPVRTKHNNDWEDKNAAILMWNARTEALPKNRTWSALNRHGESMLTIIARSETEAMRKLKKELSEPSLIYFLVQWIEADLPIQESRPLRVMEVEKND